MRGWKTVFLVDSHIHLHEYSDEELRRVCGRDDLVLLAVSDNLPSSIRTIELSEKCRNVIPAVGIHPWEIGKITDMDVKNVLGLSGRVRFFGEVGLDKKFVPETFPKQREMLAKFLAVAEKQGMGVSIHAAGAWREVLEILTSYDVRAVSIHWYTGPLELIREIHDKGYFIGVNTAITRQEKMKKVVMKAPMEIILTESDGPYRYRGLSMGPHMLPELIEIISKIKEIPKDAAISVIEGNFKTFLKKAGALSYLRGVFL